MRTVNLSLQGVSTIVSGKITTSTEYPAVRQIERTKEVKLVRVYNWFQRVVKYLFNV